MRSASWATSSMPMHHPGPSASHHGSLLLPPAMLLGGPNPQVPPQGAAALELRCGSLDTSECKPPAPVPV
ncbi:unnamed protein product [Bubo scandiacus]